MITVLYPVNALKIGGAEQQLLELVRGLDKRVFRPIVAPLYPGGALDAEFRSVPGAEVIDLRRRGKVDLWTVVRMAALMRRHAVDVVQPFLTPAAFFGLLAALLVGTPVKIVTERCGVRLARGMGYRTYRFAEDAMTRLADAVVPNSAAGRDDLLRRGIPAELIQIIYNGINAERLGAGRAGPGEGGADTVRAQLGVPSGGAVVGILASLTPPKGHGVFLRAAARVAQSLPRARFAVIGDGPLRGELEALCAQLGLRERCVFFGFQRDVAAHLRACDVLVSASLDNEGSSNSVLEAMVLGVPVVATDVGGNGEIVKDRETGRLVPAGDPEALAAAIEDILQDRERTEVLTTEARRLVQSRFSLEGMVARYEELYRALLARKRGKRAPVTSRGEVPANGRYAGHLAHLPDVRVERSL